MNNQPSVVDRVLLPVQIALFQAVFFMAGSAPWLAAVLVLTTLAGAWRRRAEATHLGLLLAATAYLIGTVGWLWPLPVVLAILVYWAIVRLSPWLCQSQPRQPLGRVDGGVAKLIALFVVVSAVALLLWVWLFQPPLGDLLTRVPQVRSWQLLLLGLLFSCVNAFAEEYVYRGLMLSVLDRVFGAGVVAIVIQAAAFGLMHIHGFPRGWFGVLLAGVYGLMLGVIRRRSGGLFAPWLTHVFADLVIFAIVAVLPQ